MSVEAQQKVTTEHLKRNAYLYIRQSTLRQVVEHTESTQRQYALRQRAVALGWQTEQIIVVDSDLGQSGASAADREGFQKLVTEVSMGRAGIVLGLEVSRLARNSTDWHRLLEISALTDTLILDEDGIYDPGHFNDRLLLGLKGTMSEAELHVMRARLRGGLLNKARRGDLKLPLPIGLVYNPEGQVVLDPDQQVQQSLRLFFATFRRIGSAFGVVRDFRQKGILFPQHPRDRARYGELLWRDLDLCQALRILHNPRYAGTFFFGRTRSRKKIEGSGVSSLRLPREQWHTLLVGAHPGYISWEEYEDNQQRLRQNAQAQGQDRANSPPREGPALLQGLVVCGVCGCRMTVRYHHSGKRLVPDYVCQRRLTLRHGCQSILGAEVDRAIGDLLVKTVTPLALEVALTVQQELQSRVEETDRLRRTQVERARYEAELARRRYLRVDPDNRLVADSLEADWNQKLRILTEAQQEYERQRQADQAMLSEEQRAQILALATDFPRLWRDSRTPDRERKRMVRLLIEDVTLHKGVQLTVQIRFKGGVQQVLILPVPVQNFQARKTSPEVIAEIDRLLDHHSYGEIASILNQCGLHSGVGLPFDAVAVGLVRRTYGLKTRYDRFRERGLLTLSEIAKILGVCKDTVKQWHRLGLLRGYAYNDIHECLYEKPGPDPPQKSQGIRRIPCQLVVTHAQEVQCEA
jgi:DNA invertase Pin-like site-specific DNA recombinase